MLATPHIFDANKSRPPPAQIGAKALRGEEEFIQGKIFGPFAVDTQVQCKGRLIQIYDPTTDPNSPAFWEYEDEQNREMGFIPAHHVVRVVKAHVAFILPASQAPL